MDNSPGAFCIGGTGPRTCGFANPLRPELDKARSDFDTPHRFNFANVWDLPFGRGRRFGSDIGAGLNAIVGGWQLNNNVTIQSGPVFSIFGNGVRADVVSGAGICRIGGIAVGPSVPFQNVFLCPASQRVFASDPDFVVNSDGNISPANVPRFGTLGRKRLPRRAQVLGRLALQEHTRPGHQRGLQRPTALQVSTS